MIIYKITNLTNGKIYIGQTVQTMRDRWHEHSRPRRGKDAGRSAISAAIKKHGKENFIIEQIDTAKTLGELNIMETTYIKALKTIAPDGYNLLLGGESRLCHPETKKKISATLKGRPFKNRWTGGNRTPPTAERREQIRAKLVGRPNTVLYKKVQCIETGTVYESVNAAAADFKVNRVTISSLLKSGKKGGKLMIKGFSFRFV